MKKRIHQIELFIKYPHDVQREVFLNLIDTAKHTVYGKTHYFNDIKTIKDFQERVPIVSYEDFYPYVERVMRGEAQVTWPGKIKWFAKSSGTTNSKSKYIPVSTEALEDCHYKGGKDLLSIYVNNYPESRMFSGKNLAIGGSQQINPMDENAESFSGDVSAVIMKNLPFWAQLSRTPKLEIALMENWEEKIEKIAHATVDENITSIAGVPTWTIFLLQRIMEMKGANNILEVWPNLELFIHGAVSFTPYRSVFKELIPSPKMHYMETYNASEGFFGIQDQKASTEMLLMLDYGIFYEFIPSEDFDSDQPRTVDLRDVELNKNYAVVISTNAGLWRYKIGDTIKFTSLNPFRFIISGRTKHFINAFGEELIVENAEKAIAIACTQTNALVDDFTAAPRYISGDQKGCHEWIIEFSQLPDSIDSFTKSLDAALRTLNSDYDAKRQKNIAVVEPIIHEVASGTFYKWMKRRGKLGGQNKVPRLSNNREYVEDILKMLEEETV
ncbi:GH3 auxin-responsive promoter family protein [Catalinimonas niigatensis]|uniref:GH3 auxin-responsive promoter family protein n=1 Tax=Catalinimonas niigatensis TaxID=1397264 RepID=UPI0026651D1B|nr:GH3 auxin-responsive promoter family protein [Catalinimonas niigatensis]WPP49832.1 GH3 auxin-responsive promoter family protein [Catalinimonas niigatensis]